MIIGVHTIKGDETLWFDYGWMINAMIAFFGTYEFRPGRPYNLAEWNNMTPRGQRVVEAVLPILPDPSRHRILVSRHLLGVDLGTRADWGEFFPEVVRIIRTELRNDAVVRVPSKSHPAASAWLAGLIDTL